MVLIYVRRHAAAIKLQTIKCQKAQKRNKYTKHNAIDLYREKLKGRCSERWLRNGEKSHDVFPTRARDLENLRRVFLFGLKIRILYFSQEMNPATVVRKIAAFWRLNCERARCFRAINARDKCEGVFSDLGFSASIVIVEQLWGVILLFPHVF